MLSIVQENHLIKWRMILAVVNAIYAITQEAWKKFRTLSGFEPIIWTFTWIPRSSTRPPPGAREPWEQSFMVFKKKRVANVKRTIKQSLSALIDVIRLYTSRKTAVPCRMTCASSALAITVLLFSGEWSDDIVQIATIFSRNEVFHFFYCEVALNEQMEHCIR